MNILTRLACSVAIVTCAHAQAAPPGALPDPAPGGMQIPHSSYDRGVIDGLSSERVATQATYLFGQLDQRDRGSLSRKDVPATLSLHAAFAEFDIDGDGQIGLAEFQAYFATEHYELRGERWFPRIAASAGGGSETRPTDGLGRTGLGTAEDDAPLGAVDAEDDDD